MNGRKGTRQRRSYSCGPCKLLKVKCDLKSPCSSCLKFKRVGKCMESPPKPPSEDEMRLINERRNRMKKRTKKQEEGWKKDESEERFSGINSNSGYGGGDFGFNSNGMGPNSSSSSSAIPFLDGSMNNIMGSGSGSGSGSNDPKPGIVSSVSSVPSMNSNSFSPPMMGYSSDISSSQTPSFEYYNDDFFLQLINDNNIGGQEVRHPLSPPNISSYLLPNGDSVIKDEFYYDRSKFMVIDKQEVNELKAIYPNKSMINVLFLSYFKSFNKDLVEVIDYRIIHKISLNFETVISNTNYDQDLTISYFDYRTITFTLAIFLSGLIIKPDITINNYKSQELIHKMTRLMKTLKLRIVLNERAFIDIIYLIVWYLLMENFYSYTSMVNECFYEYNYLLSNLLFNKKYIYYIGVQNMDLEQYNRFNDTEKAEFLLIARFWIRIRHFQIEILYFQYKSSLMQSNNTLKNSLRPDEYLVSLAFELRSSNLDYSISRYLYKLSGEYFKHFNVSNTHTNLVELIRTYLSIYVNDFHHFIGEFKDHEMVLKSSPKTNELVNFDNLVLYFKNQILLLVLVKWLSFTQVESKYFPSFRYSAYLTTMLTMFNHYIYLDDIIKTTSDDNLLSVLCKQFTYNPLKYVFHLLLLQQLLLIIIKNFIVGTKDDINGQVNGYDNGHYNGYINGNTGRTIVDLERYFMEVKNQNEEASSRLIESFNELPIKNIPLYKSTFGLLMQLKQMFNQSKYGSQLKVNELSNTIKSNLTAGQWNFFIDNYFGCYSTFINYVDKLFNLFKFINSATPPVMITPRLQFDLEIIFASKDRFYGMEMNTGMLNEYIDTVVVPSIEK